MVGFWSELLYPFGPDHAYEAPVIELAVKLIVLPMHTGLLLPATGAGGFTFTTTRVFAEPEQPFASVTTRV